MLTIRKRLFIENYKALKNASKAAIIAGYSPKSAPQRGSDLLKDKDIKEALGAWEREELEKPRKIRERLSQEVYESKLWDNVEKLDSVETITKPAPELKYKYMELYGKARGFFQNEIAGGISLIAVLSTELLNAKRKRNNPADQSLPASIEINTINSIDTTPTDSIKNNPEAGPGGEADSPDGGANINVNPLPNPAAISNPTIESINTDGGKG